MKNQFVILVIAVVLLQMVSQSEAFIGALWSGIKSLFGKRGLRNLDQYDDLFDDDSFDDDLSAADLKALQELFR